MFTLFHHPQYKGVNFRGVRFDSRGDFDVELRSNEAEEPFGVTRTRAGTFVGGESSSGTSAEAEAISDMES